MSDPYIASAAGLPAPGYCATCGSTARDCLDLGINYSDSVELDRIGAVLICTECFANFAKVMGFSNKVYSGSDTAEHIISDAENKIRRVQDEAKRLVNSLSIDLSGLRDYSFVFPVEDTEAGSSAVTVTEAGGLDTTVGQSDGPVSNKESDGVSSSSSSKSSKSSKSDSEFGIPKLSDLLS